MVNLLKTGLHNNQGLPLRIKPGFTFTCRMHDFKYRFTITQRPLGEEELKTQSDNVCHQQQKFTDYQTFWTIAHKDN